MLVAALVVGAAVIAPSATAAGTSAVDPQPVGVVVLVDESGSLADTGVAAERAATETIAQADPSTGSRLAVVGFAGRNGGPNESPVDVVCQPTTVDVSPNSDYLARCAQNLAPRNPAQGDDTDFPSALNEGLSLLNGMTGMSAKLIFMLTDGHLDVRRDPAYGADPTARQVAAEDQLTKTLAAARQQGVSIWPLGFNKAVQSELDRLAAGGASGNPLCPNNSRPTARVVNSADDILASLVEAFASGRCEGFDGPHTGTDSLTVTIPAVATNGSIAVNKVDPTLHVTYVDPNGVTAPDSGSADGSDFQLSGQTSPVEVLRIRNPVQGRWTIKVAPPPDGQPHVVSATVLWQGAVQSSVVLDPPAPRPGQSATVELVLATRRGPLADPSVLSGINAGAVLSGGGFTPVAIPLAPGTGGQFTGRVTMPTTGTGPFKLVGLVSGVGISNDQRPLDGTFDTGSVAVAAQVTFDGEQVQPGGRLDGTIRFQNNTPATHTVRLSLNDVTGGLVTISPSSATVPPDTSEVAFRLLVDNRTPVGSARGQLLVTDDTAGAVYADPIFTIDVGYPPPWWQRNWWVFAVGLAVAAVVVLLLVMLARRRRQSREVRALSAKLVNRDGRGVFTLHAPDGHGDEFPFALHEELGQLPSLRHGRDGHPTVLVRRAGPALVTVVSSGHERRQVRPGEPLDLVDGFRLEIMDDRPATSRRHTRPPRRRFSGRRSSKPDTPPTPPVPEFVGSPDSPTDNDDDLL
jgi:hypothetical protein